MKGSATASLMVDYRAASISAAKAANVDGDVTIAGRLAGDTPSWLVLRMAVLSSNVPTSTQLS